MAREVMTTRTDDPMQACDPKTKKMAGLTQNYCGKMTGSFQSRKGQPPHYAVRYKQFHETADNPLPYARVTCVACTVVRY